MSHTDGVSNPSEEEQPSFLKELLGRIRRGDREAVESLLRSVPASETPVSAGDPTEDLPPSQLPSGDATGIGAPPTLGDFELLREIGRGGMGVVYEARQLSLAKTVALKILPMASVLDHRSLLRFQNEARAAAQLQHPNIVPVHAVGADRGVHYYAMQYIEGVDFARLIARLKEHNLQRGAKETSRIASRPTLPGQGVGASRDSESSASRDFLSALSSKQSTSSREFLGPLVRSAIQVAHALHYAHSMGIVHRDIKPANLMIDTHGTTWLTDFGLAQVQGSPGVTVTGNIIGTLRYMSPEQAYANRVIVDHRTDIYSLGVTLYELLTLQPAVEGKGRAEILRRLAFEDHLRREKIDRKVPVELETIIMKSISKNPDDRYQSAEDLAEDLERLQRNEPIRARPPTPAQRVAKWSRNHRTAIATSGLVAAFLFVALAVTSVFVFAAYREAVDSLQRSEGLRLVANSTLQLEKDPALALALAVRGAELYQGLEANNALTDALSAIREVRTLNRHVEPVGSVDFSLDGALVLSTGHTSYFAKPAVQVAQIWDASSGELVRSLESDSTITSAVFSPSGGRVLAASSPLRSLSKDDREQGDVAGQPPVLWAWETNRKRVLKGAFLFSADRRSFTPDGTLVVTPAFGNAAVIWDVVEAGERRRLEGHTRRVVSAIFSPDGQRIATVSDDNTVGLWNVNDDKLLVLDSWQKDRPTATSSMILDIAFSPDGSRLVTAAWGAGIQIWDCATGQRILDQFIAGSRAEFTPDGMRLVVIRYSHIDVYDARNFERQSQLAVDSGTIKSFALSPDGTLVAIWDFGSIIHVWSLESEQLEFQLRGHTDEITSASFDRTGQSIVSGALDQTVRIWNVASGAEMRRLDRRVNRERAPLVSFSKDSQRLMIATEPRDVTQVGEINDLKNAKVIPGHLVLPQQLATRFVQASDRKVSLIDSADARELASVAIRAGPVPTQAVLSPSGTISVIIADGKAYTWETDANELNIIDISAAALAAQFNATGVLFAVWRSDGVVHIYRTETGELVHKFNRGENIRFMRFGPEGRSFLTVSSNDKLVLWDLADGAEVAELEEAGTRFTSGLFNFDGSRLIAYSESGCERVVCWDLGSNEPVCSLNFGARAVIKVATHKTEDKVAIATDVGGVILWDTVTDEQTTLTADAASAIAFAPDGRMIAALAKEPAPVGSVPVILAKNYESPAWRMWDQEGKLIEQIPTRDSYSNRLAVSRNGDFLYAQSRRYGVHIFDTAEAHEQLAIGMHGAPLTFMRFTPSGTRIVSASWDRTAAIWDAESGAELHRLVGHSAAIWAGALSPDGRRFATADVTGVVRIWDTRTGKRLREFSDHTEAVLFAEFSADNELLLTGSLDRTMRISSVAGNSVVVVKSDDEISRWAEFAPRGNRLLVIPGGRLETRFPGIPPGFAPLKRNYVKVFENFGESPFEVPQATQVLDAALIGTGDRVLVVSLRNGVELWNVGSRTVVRRFAEDRAVHSLVSFGDSRVLTVSPDQFSTWDADTGLELITIETGPSFPASPGIESYSPNGKWLATVSRDGVVRRWPADPLDSARERMPREFAAAELTRFRVPPADRAN